MLIAGLALQLATNIVFMILVAAFVRRALMYGVVRHNAPSGWQKVTWAIMISIILVFVSLDH
jgi:hypothetical protein